MRSNFTRFLTALLSFIFCLVAETAYSQNQAANSPKSAEELFQAGVNSFQKNELDQARDQFTQSLKLAPDNVESLYNLGLTEHKAKNEGLALGLWRKALALDPTNTNVAQAIAFAEKALPARSVARGGDFFESFHRSFLAETSLMSLIVLNLVLLGFAGWILIRYFAQRSRSIENEEPSPPVPYVGFIFVIGLLISALVLAAKVYDLTLTRATVVADKVEVRTSPDSQAATLFELFEGLEVIVRQSQGEWVQVSYPGGLAGWIPANVVYLSSTRSSGRQQ